MPPLLTADLSLRASAHTGVAIRTSWQANSLPGITNQALIIQPDASGLFLIPTYDPSEQRNLQIHRVDLILRDAEIAFGYRPAGMPVNLHQHSLRRLCLGGVIAKGLPQPVAADSSLNLQRLILQDRKYRLPVAVLLGFAVSLLIETVQYHTGRGWFDAEDLFNNTLGAAIGSGLFCAADRIMGKRKAGRVACEVVSVLLILAGLIGCLQMKKIVGR